MASENFVALQMSYASLIVLQRQLEQELIGGVKAFCLDLRDYQSALEGVLPEEKKIVSSHPQSGKEDVKEIVTYIREVLLQQGNLLNSCLLETKSALLIFDEKGQDFAKEAGEVRRRAAALTGICELQQILAKESSILLDSLNKDDMKSKKFLKGIFRKSN